MTDLVLAQRSDNSCGNAYSLDASLPDVEERGRDGWNVNKHRRRVDGCIAKKETLVKAKQCENYNQRHAARIQSPLKIRDSV